MRTEAFYLRQHANGLRHTPRRVFACQMAGDPLRGVGGIKRRLLRRSLSVQESSFVNFVGVRVKALHELSHVVVRAQFQYPFAPAAALRAAIPSFHQGIFSGEPESTTAARRLHFRPGVSCICLSQRSATGRARSISLPSRSSSAISGAIIVSTRPKLWL